MDAGFAVKSCLKYWFSSAHQNRQTKLAQRVCLYEGAFIITYAPIQQTSFSYHLTIRQYKKNISIYNKFLNLPQPLHCGYNMQPHKMVGYTNIISGNDPSIDVHDSSAEQLATKYSDMCSKSIETEVVFIKTETKNE